MSLLKTPTLSYHVLNENWFNVFVNKKTLCLIRIYFSSLFLSPPRSTACFRASQSELCSSTCVYFLQERSYSFELPSPFLSLYLYFFKYIYLWMYSSIWVNRVLVAACRIFQLWHVGSSSWPQIEPGPPALGVQSRSRWTTRAVPPLHIFQSFSSTMTQHKSSISPLSSLAP